jgi:hypothetical protein
MVLVLVHEVVFEKGLPARSRWEQRARADVEHAAAAGAGQGLAGGQNAKTRRAGEQRRKAAQMRTVHLNAPMIVSP